MGVTQSTESKDILDKRASALPLIQTPDDFRQRFQSLLCRSCLSSREWHWFQTVFEKFAQPGPNGMEWQASELLEFLSITTPLGLDPLLNSALPLLFRCIQQLGLFPWHQNPSKRQGISLDELMIAVIILLRRHEANRDFAAFRLYDDPAAGDETLWEPTYWFNALFFQCMVTRTNAVMTTDEVSQASRQLGDDFHLFQANRLVTYCNRVRHEKWGKYGPAIISMADLPTSNSQEFSGVVSSNEFRALVRILLASQVQIYGYGPDLVAANMDELDKVADAVLKGFEGESDGYITWDSYKTSMDTTTPNLMSSICRSLVPLIVDNEISHEQLSEASRIDAKSILQDAFNGSSRPRNLPPAGSILSFPLLAQLATFLPRNLPLQTISEAPCPSGPQKGAFHVESLSSYLDSRVHASLLLFKGSATWHLDDSGQSTDQVEIDIQFGVFLPQSGQRYGASIFQLSPKQVVCTAPSGGVPQWQVHKNDSSSSSNGQIKFVVHGPGDGVAWLSLDDKSQTGELHIPIPGRGGLISREIKISCSQLLGFAAQWNWSQVSWNNPFSVSDRPILVGAESSTDDEAESSSDDED